MQTYNRTASDVHLGREVKFFGFVDLHGCRVGDDTRIGCSIPIQRNAPVGARCRISSHAFIGEGATIEDAVFIGHEVCFTNDGLPRDCRTVGTLQSDQDWTVIETRVSRRATIGSAAMIFPGVTIGKSAVVRAGAVFTRDVVLRTIAVGNPARVLHRLRDGEAR